MKFIDFNGLQHFYEKIKASFATLNSSGKVPYKQLPDKVKKVKYIKKEKRYFFHKSIPISFNVDSEGNYNSQINGRYEDWYYSNQPVFKIAKGKKFRLFIGRKESPTDFFSEVKINNLIYWHPDFNQRLKLIGSQGNALICNNDSIINKGYDSNHIHIMYIDPENPKGYYILENYGNAAHIRQVDYEKSTDVYSIYIEFCKVYQPTPWDKNLKWVGNKVECILPTSIKDVLKSLEYYNNQYHISCRDKLIIRYYKRTNFNTDNTPTSFVTLARKRMIVSDGSVRLKNRTFIAIAKYHNFNKQSSKFMLKHDIKKGAIPKVRLRYYIKKVE